MLTVTLPGTAATLPLPDRALSTAVFTVSGRHILLDCGEGTQLALHRCRISPLKIDLIALTHFHGDHILGLPGLIQTMSILNRSLPLYITCPEEGRQSVYAALMALTDEPGFPIRLVDVPACGLSLARLNPRWPLTATLSAFPTRHRIASQGYQLRLRRIRRLEPERATALGVPQKLWRQLQQGKTVSVGDRDITPDDVCGPDRPGLTVVYTGDTMPCPAVEEAAANADLLIMDATYPDDTHAGKALEYGHSTFPQTAALAARAGAKRLWLTHYSGMIAQPEEHLDTALALFPAAECGHDGKTLRFTFRSDEM